ncbi:ribonuclease D [Pinisolibacter aquiterrae]|uniref:ribonuclease D n=1 Tax=Pinisolibacter aquiterrae TaxID=2815579 RepID=UPI001C3CA41E|nr:ribonuclease D [Pinisolibacter aquiterrae]MBV5266099.1 ribonuclease D [Pinisolibacter aquiterrae]MCC8233608.1 ribonuclease D [Pinisolibacter aquiterrae]
MQLISTTEDLAAACARLAAHPYVAVDTEFLRETTFWPKLCVAQLAGPDTAVVVDALAPGLDMGPFLDLMRNEAVVKVFHSGRQDIEIVFNLGGFVPHPVFDTQVAAMVCGFGDSISYDQLVNRISGHHIDKSSRFTDWTRRPLTPKQFDYALSDVTHLRDVYHHLKKRLEEQDRAHWVAEEMEVLTSTETYDLKPENAWERLKLRIRKPIELAILKELAAWREREARSRDVPRSRVLKDEAIFEIAADQPRDAAALSNLRSLSKGFERSRAGEEILACVKRALEIPKADLPPVPKGRPMPDGAGAAVDLMKVLLKLVCEKNGVASKVVATVDELDAIAADDAADVPVMKGWRRELFGERALELKHGRLALSFDGRKVVAVECEPVERKGAKKV